MWRPALAGAPPGSCHETGSSGLGQSEEGLQGKLSAAQRRYQGGKDGLLVKNGSLPGMTVSCSEVELLGLPGSATLPVV